MASIKQRFRPAKELNLVFIIGGTQSLEAQELASTLVYATCVLSLIVENGTHIYIYIYLLSLGLIDSVSRFAYLRIYIHS